MKRDSFSLTLLTTKFVFLVKIKRSLEFQFLITIIIVMIIVMYYIYVVVISNQLFCIYTYKYLKKKISFAFGETHLMFRFIY